MRSREKLKVLNLINHHIYYRQFFQGGEILQEALIQNYLVLRVSLIRLVQNTNP